MRASSSVVRLGLPWLPGWLGRGSVSSPRTGRAWAWLLACFYDSTTTDLPMMMLEEEIPVPS